MTDLRDARGTMWRALHLYPDGGLAIEGHDLGAAVEEVFGYGEYEFERRLSPAETTRVRGLLGLAPGDDLLDALAGRFRTTRDVEDFLAGNGIAGDLRSRIGD